MTNYFINLRWKLYEFYSRQLLLWGLDKGHIRPYDEKLIEKLRDIYYGGLPASVLLLCLSITNGNCYDRALLMSRAFLEDDGDVRLVYAAVADLKFNPIYAKNKDKESADHCFVERITKDGKHYIYDTSLGFVYKKWIYWLIDFPKVRKINDKRSIINFIKEDEDIHPDKPMSDILVRNFVLSNIETTYDRGEMYAMLGLLQREVELFRFTPV